MKGIKRKVIPRFRRESRVLDEEARTAAPGEFVKLAEGFTHYQLAGPHDGQPVVLVHGFSTPCYIWDPTFDDLAAAGFRVLRYDLYGRGYSDRPDTVYDLALFERQLLGLLSALGIEPAVDLFGLSMGGQIAAIFVDRHPARVRKLGLIDPAGFSPAIPFAARLLLAPVLGELVMGLFGDRLLVSGLDGDFYRPERFPEYRERYLDQMEYRGFKRALLSTMRNGLFEDLSATYARVGKQNRPILLIWGRHDRTIPFENHKKARQIMPRAEFQAIDEAGHLPHYEQPGVVSPILIEFLKK